MTSTRIAIALAALSLGSCRAGADSAENPAVPDEGMHLPWSGIGPEEAVRFTGTEPFWSGEVALGRLTWKTPEDQAGTAFPVERFAGRNGLGFSGTLAGASFQLAVSEADCSDGMSERRFPFTVTVRHGGQTLSGCGWTQARPFSGPQEP